jgi:hypothetical protein
LDRKRFLKFEKERSNTLDVSTVMDHVQNNDAKVSDEQEQKLEIEPCMEKNETKTIEQNDIEGNLKIKRSLTDDEKRPIEKKMKTVRKNFLFVLKSFRSSNVFQ